MEEESEYEEDTETEEEQEEQEGQGKMEEKDEEEPKTARQISVEIPPNIEAPKRYGNELKFEAHDRFTNDRGLAEIEV